MTAKIHRLALLLLLLLFPLDYALANASGLLWKLEKPGIAPSYLYGTIHVDDPRINDLAPAVLDAFAASRNVLLELEMTPELADAAARRMMLPPDTLLADRIDPAIHRRTVEAMAARGVPEAATTRLRPWAIAVALSIPPQEGTPLDLRLHRRASEAGKPIVGLETMDEQLDVFDALSPEEEERYLNDTLDDLANIGEHTEKLLQAYLRQDLAALERLATEFVDKNSAYAKPLMRRLIEDRNHRMTERMLPHVDKGAAFIAIGALHLPGEEGVLQLLRQHGWTVTAVH